MEWADLSEQQTEDLIAWYNIREEDLDDDDRKRLVALVADDRFAAWNCPQCGERVRMGNPEKWGNFQGVLQPDFCSYPGNADRHTLEYLSRMCDNCRMGDVDREDDGPEEWGATDLLERV